MKNFNVFIVKIDGKMQFASEIKSANARRKLKRYGSNLRTKLYCKGNNKSNERRFRRKIGVFSLWFGCWHNELSRPFSDAKESYRTCLSCGARRRFSAESLKTFGVFYYPPTVTSAKNKQ